MDRFAESELDKILGGAKRNPGILVRRDADPEGVEGKSLIVGPLQDDAFLHVGFSKRPSWDLGVVRPRLPAR